MAKRKSKEPEIDLEVLDEASDTELVQICRNLGIETASRQMSREELIAAILSTPEEAPEDPLKEVRRKTYLYVQKNRRSIRTSLMDCDFYCPGCPHNKVVDCYADNNVYVDTQQAEE